MTDFDNLDDTPAPARRKRVSPVWLWLFVAICFVGLATLLYFRYGVWVHPIHEPTPLDLVQMDLAGRLGTSFEIVSTETVHDINRRPLLRVKYRQPKVGGGWLFGDRVYCIEEGKLLWGQDYHFWKWVLSSGLVGIIGDPRLRQWGRVRSLARGPDSQRLVTGSDDQLIRIWNTATGMQQMTIPVGNYRGWADLSRDRSRK